MSFHCLVQRWRGACKGRDATVRPKTIKGCHAKLMTIGSVNDKKRSGRPFIRQLESAGNVDVRTWLDQYFPGQQMGQRRPHEWPLRTPDFNPAKPRTLSGLEIPIQEVLNNISDDILQNVVHSFPGRLRKLIDASGTCAEI